MVTCDFLINIQALCPLSYMRTMLSGLLLLPETYLFCLHMNP